MAFDITQLFTTTPKKPFAPSEELKKLLGQEQATLLAQQKPGYKEEPTNYQINPKQIQNLFGAGAKTPEDKAIPGQLTELANIWLTEEQKKRRNELKPSAKETAQQTFEQAQAGTGPGNVPSLALLNLGEKRLSEESAAGSAEQKRMDEYNKMIQDQIEKAAERRSKEKQTSTPGWKPGELELKTQETLNTNPEYLTAISKLGKAKNPRDKALAQQEIAAITNKMSLLIQGTRPVGIEPGPEIQTTTSLTKPGISTVREGGGQVVGATGPIRQLGQRIFPGGKTGKEARVSLPTGITVKGKSITPDVFGQLPVKDKARLIVDSGSANADPLLKSAYTAIASGKDPQLILARVNQERAKANLPAVASLF